MSCPPARRVARTVQAEVARHVQAEVAEKVARKMEGRAGREERWNPQRAAAAARRARKEADRSTNFQVLGAVLLAIGGNWLLAEMGLFTLGWPALLAVALMTLGVGLIGTAKAGRTAPMVFIGVALTVALAMASGVGGPFRGPIADQSFTPISVSQLQETYEGRVGDIDLDLTELDLSGQSPVINAGLGVGDLHVVVPDGVELRIEAEVGLGDIDVLGEVDEGFGPDVSYESPGFAEAEERLLLNLEVGMGDIVVERG